MSGETSTSLLDRVRDRNDSQSWKVLVELYTPLIRGWLRQHAGSGVETDDLIQDVLMVVVRRIPDFQREPRTGAFRAWLKAITINCLRDAWKARRHRAAGSGDSRVAELLREWEDPNSGLSQMWEQDHDRHITQQLLDMIRPQFTEKTWSAFERFALGGESAEDVAKALGTTVNAVFIAKSRVLAVLRREGGGLLE